MFKTSKRPADRDTASPLWQDGTDELTWVSQGEARGGGDVICLPIDFHWDFLEKLWFRAGWTHVPGVCGMAGLYAICLISVAGLHFCLQKASCMFLFFLYEKRIVQSAWGN